MSIRRAGEADRETLWALWNELSRERPPPDWMTEAQDEARADIERSLTGGAAVLAERDGDPVGFAFGFPGRSGTAYLSDLYVRPDARRAGVATDLIREFVAAMGERGATFVLLNVDAGNGEARALYERIGFEVRGVDMAAEVSALTARLEQRPVEPSFGSIHVQSDDTPAVERAVRQFVPRLPGGSRGSLVAQPRNGWIAVYDDVCDRDPRQLRRLARELSERMGAVVLVLGVEEGQVARFILLERGGIVDEYLSVQEYYGPLPPGDVVALQANPRVVARLTGADPGALRAAAVHAVSAADLPPAREILGLLARVMGVEGGDRGFADAGEVPGAILVERR